MSLLRRRQPERFFVPRVGHRLRLSVRRMPNICFPDPLGRFFGVAWEVGGGIAQQVVLC